MKTMKNVKVSKRTLHPLKTSAIGLIVNLLLFIAKIAIGLISGSVSIIADAVANFSDFISVGVMMFSFLISHKPPDKNHPFGHARSEYLSAFIISFLIMFVGAQFLIDSAKNIFENNHVSLSSAAITVLILSVIAKIILAIIYYHSNKKTKSNTIRAAMIDSRNDAIITLVILTGLIVGENFSFSIDGVLGVLVSLFVIRSGFGMVRDSIDDLVGARPTTEIAQSIRLLRSYTDIHGFHDLLLHNYGVKKFFGSVDVEVPEDLSLTEAHAIANRIEKDFERKLSIDMIVHVDPVGKLSERDKAILELIGQIVTEISPDYKVHNFVSGDKAISLTLDLPSEMREQSKKIIEVVKNQIAEDFGGLKVKITPSFDDFLA